MARKRKRGSNLTPNQAEWKRQVSRVKKSIRKLEKQGYEVPSWVIPDKPVHVTEKSLSSIKEINTKYLRSVSEKTSPRDSFMKHNSYSYAGENESTDVSEEILNNFRELLSRFDPPRDKYAVTRFEINYHKIYNIFDYYESQYGSSGLSDVIELNAESIMTDIQVALYDSNQETVNAAISSIATTLAGRPLTEAESKDITDAYEHNENWDDI